MPETSSPWYRDGLRFACQPGCGRCCRGPGGYVLVNESEVKSLAEAMGMSPAQFAGRFLRRILGGLALCDAPNGDCILLAEDGRCRIYAARPVQCRTFPWWPEILRDRSAWEKAKSRCPGIGRGEKRSAAEIQAALRSQERSGLAWLGSVAAQV